MWDIRNYKEKKKKRSVEVAKFNVVENSKFFWHNKSKA